MAGEQVFQVSNTFLNFFVFFFNLFPFQSGKTTKTHIQNGNSLLFGKLEVVHQCYLGDSIGLGFTDGSDYRINVVQRDQEAFQDMSLGLSLVQFKLASPGYYFLLMFQVVIQDFLQVQFPWMSIHQSQHNGSKCGLQLGMLKQVVQHNLRIDVSTQFNGNAHTGTVGFIAKSGNSIQYFLAGQIGNTFNDSGLVYLIWDFCYYNTVFAMGHLFNMGFGTSHNSPASLSVCFDNPVPALNQAPCWEIRSLNLSHQLINGDIRIINHHAQAIYYFPQIVRRNIGCHADGNPIGTIDQKIRDTGWQYYRFLQRTIIVWHKINGILVQIPEHFHSQFGHTHFSITHSGRRVSVNGAKVTMPIYQQIAGRKILCHTYCGFIYGGITMRMILTKNIADNTSRLLIWFARKHTRFLHRIKDSSVYRLETISHIRKCTGYNN